MSDVILPSNFQLKSEYVGLTDWLKNDIDTIALQHIEKLQASYLKKYADKEDAKALFHMHIEKNKLEKYECTFNVNYDWNTFHWHNDVPFKEPFDVVNHAFKHLKEHIAHNK